MFYTSAEQYLNELKEQLEETLMDLAELKKAAIENEDFPGASKLRDIEHCTLKFLNALNTTGTNWSK